MESPRVFFDIQLIGVTSGLLLLFYLGTGILLAILSFTKKHGRSRWPLHLLLATCLLCFSTGMIDTGFSATEILHTLQSSGGSDPEVTLVYAIESVAGLFWYGVTGIFLASLAFLRAAYGLIREPGPRF